MYNNSTMNASTLSSNLSFSSPYQKYERDELITDEISLQRYLKYVFFISLIWFQISFKLFISFSEMFLARSTVQLKSQT